MVVYIVRVYLTVVPCSNLAHENSTLGLETKAQVVIEHYFTLRSSLDFPQEIQGVECH